LEVQFFLGPPPEYLTSLSIKIHLNLHALTSIQLFEVHFAKKNLLEVFSANGPGTASIIPNFPFDQNPSQPSSSDEHSISPKEEELATQENRSSAAELTKSAADTFDGMIELFKFPELSVIHIL
jgi:hypothetical protein